MSRLQRTVCAVFVFLCIVVGLTTPSLIVMLGALAGIIAVGFLAFRHGPRPPLLSLAFVMLLIAAPVLGQGDTTPSLPPLDVVGIIDTAAKFIIPVVLAFIGSPATTTIVGVLKRIPALNRFTSEGMATFVGLVLMALLAIATAAGLDGQFRTILDSVLAVLGVVTALPTNVAFAAQVYNVARTNAWPILGYKRPTTSQAVHSKTSMTDLIGGS